MSNLTDRPDPGDPLDRDLAALYEGPAPALASAIPSKPAAAPSNRPRLLRLVRNRWTPALATAAACLTAAAIVLLPGWLGGASTSVNAEQIFERASAAANSSVATTSYHLVAVS